MSLITLIMSLCVPHSLQPIVVPLDSIWISIRRSLITLKYWDSITDATVAFDKCFTQTVDELVVSIDVGKTKDNG